MVQFDEEKQNKRVEALHKEEEENLANALSQKYGIPYLDLSTVAVNSEALRIITLEEAQAAQIGVFDVLEKKLKVATLAPENTQTKEAFDKLRERGYQLSLFMVSLESLKKVWDRYKDLSFSFETKSGALDISNEEITKFIDEVKSLADIQKIIADLLKTKKSHMVSRILEVILAGALALKASDVHLEPQETETRLRYRLDGVLVDVINIQSDVYPLFLSRVKLLSGMKLNIKGLAQDGRFSIRLADTEIEIRASVLPESYNDSIVLRVLNPKSIAVALEEMGINDRLFKIIEQQIAKPNGMILTTGPTGSGKTTTLYAFLKKIYSPEIKIITIENPIEYHLTGIVQTQTDSKKGYTFQEGLRSALRQDPDVIMVGEIRDTETAEIAINSALTGHLVFSTLHTNNAAGTFPRLIDLGVNPKVITSAITIALAQRLVRKICPDCKEEKIIEGEDKTLVEKTLNSVKDKTEIKGLQSEKIWTAKGCEKCNFTGYKGRIGLFEGIIADEKIEEAVNKNPSEREIWKAAESQNILSMRQDGIIKVLKGITTIDELGRVIDLTAEF